MKGFARNRDSNEPEIVEALKAAGASVTRLNETGVPDLLVGFRRRTFLFEVKRGGVNKRVLKHGHDEADERGLARTQQLWWDRWRGVPPMIITTAAEALAAIGAERSSE